jgi:hypothetical protein
MKVKKFFARIFLVYLEGTLDPLISALGKRRG